MMTHSVSHIETRAGSRFGRYCRELMIYGITALAAFAAILWLAGCDNPPQNDQQVKQQAAQTTEQVKADGKQAVADTRAAAGQAEQKLNDVAAGVKEGIHSNTAPNGATTKL